MHTRLHTYLMYRVLTVGTRRCYENLRRIFHKQQSGKEHFVENQAMRRKYRSRRERVSGEYM